MSAIRATYLDSSALLKLAVEEDESAALRAYLRGRRMQVASAIARVEVHRSLVRLGDTGAAKRVRALFTAVELVAMTGRILDAARSIEPPELRSLDALHLATALRFEGQLAGFVTYDDRLARAATAYGIRVVQPA